MRIVLFCHSLLSDWNHGNAHFLRGICTELAARGHLVDVFEPRDAWSVLNLVADHGEEALDSARGVYPAMRIHRYDERTIDLSEALDDAALVLVHEWNTHDVVRRIGRHRAASGRYVLLFHDTHHRSVSDPAAMAAYELSAYDGVLAFGEVIRERYVRAGWSQRAWTWHEAADTCIFQPHPETPREGDVAWIGNWGDEERTTELREFLVEPIQQLSASATVHGVRYPDDAVRNLRAAGIIFAGWLPNFRVPDVFARHCVTVHIPRRPYTRMLPGIPTIRPFEALACGIPLVSAPWDDVEGLFTAGRDYLVAPNGSAMKRALFDVLHDAELAASLAEHGRQTLESRHTCAHRVDELLGIVKALRDPRIPNPESRTPEPGNLVPL
jgi:spore maturation protein CgeB